MHAWAKHSSRNWSAVYWVPSPAGRVPFTRASPTTRRPPPSQSGKEACGSEHTGAVGHPHVGALMDPRVPRQSEQGPTMQTHWTAGRVARMLDIRDELAWDEHRTATSTLNTRRAR